MLCGCETWIAEAEEIIGICSVMLEKGAEDKPKT